MNGGRAAMLALAAAAVCAAQQASDFAGTWVHRVGRQAIFKIVLSAEGGAIRGGVTKPKEMTVDLDGAFTAISAAKVEAPVQKAVLQGARLTVG